MFLPFFDQLRQHKVPVSMREFLAFLDGMAAGLATYDVDAFYYLARTSMVKDERNIDKFDRAFAAAFSGLENISLDDVMDHQHMHKSCAYCRRTLIRQNRTTTDGTSK